MTRARRSGRPGTREDLCHKSGGSRSAGRRAPARCRRRRRLCQAAGPATGSDQADSPCTLEGQAKRAIQTRRPNETARVDAPAGRRDDGGATLRAQQRRCRFSRHTRFRPAEFPLRSARAGRNRLCRGTKIGDQYAGRGHYDRLPLAAILSAARSTSSVGWPASALTQKQSTIDRLRDADPVGRVWSPVSRDRVAISRASAP